MNLSSLDGCKLTIGSYPTFHYNAEGGGGKGILDLDGDSGKQKLYFNPKNFKVPSLNWRNTKLLNIAMPPGLEIEIITEKLDGYLDICNGNISLEFEAKFVLSIFSIINAPKLEIKTDLVNKTNYKSYSKPFKNEDKIILSGSSLVAPTGNYMLDNFLSLPNKAEAILICKINQLPNQ